MNKHHGEMVELDVPHASPQRTRGHKPIIWIAGGIPMLATVLAFLGPLHWSLDLLSHLRFQYTIILLITCLLCVFLRRMRPAMVFLIPLALNLMMIVPLYLHPGLGERKMVATAAVVTEASPAPVESTLPMQLAPPMESANAGEAVKAAAPAVTPTAAVPAQLTTPAPAPATTPAATPGGADAPAAAASKGETTGEYTFNPEPERDRRLLRILNLHLPHQLGDQEVLNYVREHDADVIIFHQVSKPQLDATEFQVAPFRIVESATRPDGYGIAVGVRMMLRHLVRKSESRVLQLTDDPQQIPAIEAKFIWSGETLNLLAVHLHPPIGAEASAWHQQEMKAIAVWARQQTGLVVVAGQFNATPWSAAFQRVVTDSGLVNSQRGFGIQASWPANGGPVGGIPINHLLHSPNLVTAARRLGPALTAEQSPLEVVLIREGEYAAYRQEQAQKPMTLGPEKKVVEKK